MRERALRVLSYLDPAPDLLIVANGLEPHVDHGFFYLFDAPSGLFEGSTMAVRPDGSAHVVVPALEEESARVAAKNDPSITVDVPPTDVRYGNRVEWLKQYFSQFVGERPTVALNFRDLTHAYFLDMSQALPQAKFVDASEAFRKARMVKDPAELERLAASGAIVSKVAEKIPSLLRPGMTEVDLAGEIEYAMSREGASGRSFDTIVGFGPATAEPHYKPNTRRLERGDAVLCDFGAYHRRYASDITRSFQFGPPKQGMRQMYETVKTAHAAAVEAARAGVAAKEVHLAAERVIDAGEWKGRFIHGVGHSVGLAVHDGFGMGPNTNELLSEGMAITIEPGIYVPGRGGVRIEDDIVVTSGRPRFLTTASREYVEVNA